jgi:hypothetical protein
LHLFPYPLQIKATIGCLPIKIDTCNGDLVLTITKVIAENTITIENYLILLKNLFGSNPNQLEITIRKLETSPLPFLTSEDAAEEEGGEGP